METQGELAEGFEIYGESVNPPRVTVRGPSSFIRGLISVPTDKIDIAGKQFDFISRQVPLNLSNPKATAPESVVDVSFRIGERRVEKTFSVPAGGSGKRAQVVLFGGRSLIDGIKPEDIIVMLNEESDKPQVVLPDMLNGRVEVRRVRLN